jgi:hypothetical protein
MLWNDVANKFSFSIATSSYVSASTYSTNTWYHIAWVRDGSNNLSLYVNGLRDSTTAGVSASLYTGNPIIGARNDGTTPYTGYISNFRVTNTVVYSGTTYTVPTSQLTAIAGTTVLTCQSPTFVDNSSNRSAITAAGNSRPSQTNPFGFTAGAKTSYTPAVYGGSMYFDGTGDFLSVPNSSAFTLGTNSFTIEFWLYPIAATTGWVLGKGDAATAAGSTLSFYLAGTNWEFYSGSSTLGLTKPTLAANTWQHVAVVRNSTTITIYLNGTSVSSLSVGTTSINTTTQPVQLGSYSTGGYNGYVSNFRIVNGAALYTSSFVPPTAPLTPIINTTLLLNGTGAAIYDASMGNNLETVGDAKLSTAVVKYGSTSMAFDGTGDYIVQPTSINYGYGTGDFTIEFWLYFNTVSSDQTIVSNLTSASSVNPHIYLLGSGSTIRYYTNNADRIVGSAVSINTWYHVAVSRNAGSTRLFINGTQSGSTYTDSNNYGTSAPLGVATYWAAGSPVTFSPLNGYISDLRITKGAARYTANFTPPTAASKKK